MLIRTEGFLFSHLLPLQPRGPAGCEGTRSCLAEMTHVRSNSLISEVQLDRVLAPKLKRLSAPSCALCCHYQGAARPFVKCTPAEEFR